MISFEEVIANVSIILETKVIEKCIVSVSEMTKHKLVLQLFDLSAPQTSMNLNTTQVHACRATYPQKLGLEEHFIEKCSQSQDMSKRRMPLLVVVLPGHMKSSPSTITCLSQDCCLNTAQGMHLHWGKAVSKQNVPSEIRTGIILKVTDASKTFRD